jgi:hypothetical protein
MPHTVRLRTDVFTKAARLAGFRSDYALAKAMGVNRSTVARVTSGALQPGPAFIGGALGRLVPRCSFTTCSRSFPRRRKRGRVVTKDELLYSAWLANLNHRLGRYAVRLMDEANPTATTEYTVPLAEVEAALGNDLLELADAILGKSAGFRVLAQSSGRWAQLPHTPEPSTHQSSATDTSR